MLYRNDLEMLCRNDFVAENEINIFAAVKVAISHHLSGFSTAVRPPLRGATSEESKKLLDVLSKTL